MQHPAHHPPILGLAGGIGAGKSTVARILAEEGCVVADSDDLARQAYNDPAIREQLVAWWGDRIRDCRGCHAEPDSLPPPVDRRAIAAIVFEQPAERVRLESLIHPWIARHREALFAAAPAGTRALVIDAPLLFETGLDKRCERVIFVDSSAESRFSSVRAARGWDAGELGRREAAQWPLDRKRALAHHVIRNDGDPASLRAQVRAVLDEACARSPA
ncbi:MAG: dephospho-CoA kinase [Phycisphaerales bacterium]